MPTDTAVGASSSARTCSSGSFSARTSRSTTSPQRSRPTTPTRTTRSPSRASAAAVLKCPPAAAAKPSANTSRPGSGHFGSPARMTSQVGRPGTTTSTSASVLEREPKPRELLDGVPPFDRRLDVELLRDLRILADQLARAAGKLLARGLRRLPDVHGAPTLGRLVGDPRLEAEAGKLRE